MAYIRKRQINNRVLIIQEAARMFVEEGYTKSSINKIAQTLHLSLGNITFYFKTKEHLLAVLVDEMFDYQRRMMDEYVEEGKSSLLAYCLELTAIAAVCEESEVARDFYASSYASALTLEKIRKNDTERVKEIFASFQAEWTNEQWVATENIVSGIEYATIMTREETTPLALQIEKTLDTILYLFGVPQNIRQAKIQKVLRMDYRAIGHRLLKEFPKYVRKINAEHVREEQNKEDKQ